MIYEPEYRSIKSLFISLRYFAYWHALRTHALGQLGWVKSRKFKRSTDAFGSVPWWTHSLTYFLHQAVSSESTVLEIGGGASTIWWLSRGNSVTTVETDYKWAEDLQEQVHALSLGQRWTLVHVSSIPSSQLMDGLKGKTFDIVVNDGLGDRVEALDLLNNHVTNSGLIIWDNTDRAEYATGISRLIALGGWKPLHFFGLVPINAFASQSTLFFRDYIHILGSSPEFPTVVT
jgi:hypothetical protein